MKTAAWVGRALPLVLIAMIALVVWINAGRQAQPALGASCADLAAGCQAQMHGRDIALGVSAPIKPLKPFEIWVRAGGAKRVEARFSMEGMDMGFNLYPLRADSQGTFRASVTLPVCVSGRRDWVMILDIDGTSLAVPFVTQP
jgi:hypothetical protein